MTTRSIEEKAKLSKEIIKSIIVEIDRIESNGENYISSRQLDHIIYELEKVRELAKDF